MTSMKPRSASTPNCWQAPLLEGRLFLSGYNERAAARELARAQQINPLAAEVLVTLGGPICRATAWPPGGPRPSEPWASIRTTRPAYVLLADLNISDERFVDAKAAARQGSRRESSR